MSPCTTRSRPNGRHDTRLQEEWGLPPREILAELDAQGCSDTQIQAILVISRARYYHYRSTLGFVRRKTWTLGSTGTDPPPEK